MSLQFNSRAASATGAASVLRAVSPDDGADLPEGATRAVFVGGAGALTVIDETGAQTTLLSAAAQYHPIRVRRVMATGTDATDIVAMY